VSQDRDCLDNCHTGLREGVPPVHTLFVLYDPFGYFVLTHRRDYVVSKPCTCADLVDTRP